MRATAKVSARGQITLPVAMRREFGIAPGATVEIVTGEGEIVIRRRRSISELFGIFHDRLPPGAPLGWEEERRIMEEAVARQVADE